MTNTLGTTDATQRFDAWGNTIAATGTAPHYGYTGREPDETGLIYYRARYYDPSLARFTQRDPIGFVGGINLYAYVENNPINFIDPMGEDNFIFTPGNPIPTVESTANFSPPKYFLDTGSQLIPAGASATNILSGNGGFNGAVTTESAVSNIVNQNITNIVNSSSVGLSDPNSNTFNLPLLQEVAANSGQTGIWDVKRGLNSTDLYVVNGKLQSHDYLGNYIWGAGLNQIGISQWMAQTGAFLQGTVGESISQGDLVFESLSDQYAISAGYDFNYNPTLGPSDPSSSDASGGFVLYSSRP